jgi:hypothetical protein
MRLQELIHVHSLLFEIRAYLQREDDSFDGVFEAYTSQPVRPFHIHRPKGAHTEAITILLRGFDESISHTHPPPNDRLQMEIDP